MPPLLWGGSIEVSTCHRRMAHNRQRYLTHRCEVQALQFHLNPSPSVMGHLCPFDGPWDGHGLCNDGPIAHTNFRKHRGGCHVCLYSISCSPYHAHRKKVFPLRRLDCHMGHPRHYNSLWTPWIGSVLPWFTLPVASMKAWWHLWFASPSAYTT